MSSKSTNTFVFSFIMCVVCSLTLTAAAVGLKGRQDRNIEIDRQKNVLKALSLVDRGQSYSGDVIQAIYIEKVQEQYVTDTGSLVDTKTALPIFVVKKEDAIEKYAVPFRAYGLWSWIEGYIAVDGDGETVIGMTVYNHGETPGLGGECEKAWFQDQFVGKKLVDIEGNFVSLGVLKGKIKDTNLTPEQQKNVVDGMSGATITSKGIEKYLRQDLEKYEPFSMALRRG